MNEAKPDTQRKWEEMLDEVRRLRDGLGMPVDERIVETVTILRLMGIRTIMSCAGHYERQTNGPYVIFQAPEVPELSKRLKGISEADENERKQLSNEIVKMNIFERQKLWPFLEEFYANRLVPYNQRLCIRTTFANYLGCQGSDLTSILGREQRYKLLEGCQLEMKAFTDYLKKCYFANREGPVPPV